MAKTLNEIGKNAKLKERKKWPHEKPQLKNARKLQGIYFIDPKDKEFKETIKNARKKLETPMVPLCLARHARKVSIVRLEVRPMISNQNLRVSWKLVNPQDCMEESLPNYHEDHIAGKADNSLQHCNLVHKFSCASSNEDSRSKSSSG